MGLKTNIYFFVNGDDIINLVISKNQFFINWGKRVFISPMHRITKIEIDKKNECSKFYFGIGQDKKTNSCIIFHYNKESDDFFSQLPQKFSNAIKNNTKIKLFGPSSEPSPIIAEFDLSSFVDEIKKSNKLMIIDVPKDLTVIQVLKRNSFWNKLRGFEEYASIERIGLLGLPYATKIPIKHYTPSEKKEAKNIYFLIERFAEDLQNFKYGF